MTQYAITEYGRGEVVDRQSTRGRTQYKVAGHGWSLWVESALLQLDDHPPVLQDNSTTLPYNPRPQHPSDVFTVPLTDLRVDADERLHPADSVSFEEEPEPQEPVPAAHLFAEATVDEVPGHLDRRHGDDPRLAAVPEDLPPDSILARLRHDPVRVVADLRQAHHADDEIALEPHTAAYLDLLDHDEGLRTAAWKDVRAKALRLRREGAVDVIGTTESSIYAYVTGDNDTYETIVVRSGALTGDSSISEWDCTCPWGHWAFKRSTYVGRLCSHAYAAYLEMQSQHQRRTKSPKWYAGLDREGAGERAVGQPSPAAPAPPDTGGGQMMDQGIDQSMAMDPGTAADRPGGGLVQGGRDGHMPPPGTLTFERGSLHFDERHIPYAPRRWHDELPANGTALGRGTGIAAAVGLEAALIDLERVLDPEDQALLERLRTLSDEGNRPQHNRARNDELREVVMELRERGYNADNITAALAVQGGYPDYTPGDHQPFAGSGPDPRTSVETSQSYVDRHERPHHQRIAEVELPPLEGDHGWRAASLESIREYGETDPLAPGGRTAAAPVDADDPALAMFTAEAEPRQAAVTESGGDPLAYLLDGIPKIAGRQYSPAEQQALMNEASADGRPFDQNELDLTGTHYLG